MIKFATKNHSYDAFNNVGKGDQIHWPENLTKTLVFCKKTCNNKNLDRIISMMLSFNLPKIDEEIEKNKDKIKEVLLAMIDKKKCE